MKERGAAMIPTEDIMPIVKNTIAASIKYRKEVQFRPVL